MAMIPFKKTPGLGDVVVQPTDRDLTSRINEVKDTLDVNTFIDKLRLCCNMKLGYLCGFHFRSTKSDVLLKDFFIVYVPKIKGAMTRQIERGYSNWYVWQYVDAANVVVLSKEDLMKEYGFDLDKFFKSDWFVSKASKMKKFILGKLNTVVKPYVDKIGDSALKRDASWYVKAIEDAIIDLFRVNSITTDQDGTTHFNHRKELYTFDQKEFDREKKVADVAKGFNDWRAEQAAKKAQGEA